MLVSLFRRGAFFTKLSFIIFGAANMAHKQIVKGLIFLAAEAAYIFYMAVSGVHNLIMLYFFRTFQEKDISHKAMSC